MIIFYFFFFKQKTAYEMRISDWSSDVCSSDLDAGSPQTRSRKGKAGRAQFSSAIGNGSDVAGCGKQAGWQEDGGRAMTEIRIVDTTLRDGHQIGRASCRERVCQYV